VRIVFIGDKLVSGEDTTVVDSDEFYNSFADETDGSHWGFKGFPYAFGELLKEKKPK
jgi:hypothetical protein